MKSYSDILAALEARKDRSAWNKGVTAYAVDLLDNYQERAEYEGREAASCKELEEWLLNGASTWSKYSWGGVLLACIALPPLLTGLQDIVLDALPCALRIIADLRAVLFCGPYCDTVPTLIIFDAGAGVCC